MIDINAGLPFDLSPFKAGERAYLTELHSSCVGVANNALEMIPVNHPRKKYHVRPHSEDVIRGIVAMAQEAIPAGRLTVEEGLMGIAIGGIHDVFVDTDLIGTGENERKSAVIGEVLMSQYSIFTPYHYERVESGAVATIFTCADENGINQSAPDDDYLAKIVVDADSGGIGMPWPEAWPRITRWYREDKGKEPDMEDPDFIKFLEFEVVVLGGHRYMTEEGQRRYNHTTANKKTIKSILATRKTN